VDEQGSGITVATFGDAQKFRLPSGGILPRHKAKICGEFPAVFEVGGDTRHAQQDSGGQKTNARHLHQTSTGFVSSERNL